MFFMKTHSVVFSCLDIILQGFGVLGIDSSWNKRIPIAGSKKFMNFAFLWKKLAIFAFFRRNSRILFFLFEEIHELYILFGENLWISHFVQRNSRFFFIFVIRDLRILRFVWRKSRILIRGDTLSANCFIASGIWESGRKSRI